MAAVVAVTARSLRDVAQRGARVGALHLRRSPDLLCKNLMCEHVGDPCVCKLSLVLERVPELEDMDLSANRLRALPASAFALRRLTHLNLAENALVALPAEVTGLADLRVLDVSHNRLTDIPDDLVAGLPALEELRVTGNPLSDEARARLERHRLRGLDVVFG